ncbi:MAG: hypothetical protein NC429_03510 [Lachnospiraceae bacterium]|nr:hypothetical protein [Lachnospiraceae bacterium]
MSDQKELLFARTLEQVKKTAKEQNNCILKEQVKEAFRELAFSEEQLQMVFDYLEKHKIGIDEPVDLDDYLTESEMDYLEEYRRELALLEKAGGGEREAVILSAMAGDTQAQSRLIQIFLPEVMETARLYTGQGVYLEDLIGEGNVALAAGVSSLGAFEHAREAEGALMRMVMDAMEDCIAENMQEADKDKKLADKVNKVAAKAKELADELHRKVTAAELAEETGMSLKYIEDAMRMSGFAIEDLEKET